jgi:hypothetical protein
MTPSPIPHHDGFSRPKQRLFLETLGITGSVKAAAAAAGVSRVTVYRLRNAPDGALFRAGWEEALARAYTLLADLALSRAIEGVEEPVFWKGEEVGTRTRYNDRLLMFLMRNAARYQPSWSPDPARWQESRPLHSPDGFAETLDALCPPYARLRIEDMAGAGGVAAGETIAAGEADEGSEAGNEAVTDRPGTPDPEPRPGPRCRSLV